MTNTGICDEDKNNDNDDHHGEMETKHDTEKNDSYSKQGKYQNKMEAKCDTEKNDNDNNHGNYQNETEAMRRKGTHTEKNEHHNANESKNISGTHENFMNDGDESKERQSKLTTTDDKTLNNHNNNNNNDHDQTQGNQTITSKRKGKYQNDTWGLHNKCIAFLALDPDCNDRCC